MENFLLQVLGIALFLLLIMFSIGLHEIGHMVPAKKFGVRVPEYMVGFGPTLWSRKKGETTYGLKALPIGGYVRLVGMFPPADPAAAEDASGKKLGRWKQMIQDAKTAAAKEIQPGDENRVFYKLPVHKRLIVMFGGPFMNLVLAFVFFAIMLVGFGTPQPSKEILFASPCVPVSATVEQVAIADLDASDCPEGYAPSPAYTAGLRDGDILTRVNGTELSSWEDFTAAIISSRGNNQDITFIRDGQESTVTVTPIQVTTPVYDEYLNETGQTEERYLVGVNPKYEYERGGLLDVPVYTWDITVLAAEGLVAFPEKLYSLTTETIFGNQERSLDTPVSVVGITRLGGDVAANDQPLISKIVFFLGLIGVLNLFLFLFNLLPILPLDGGHIAVASYEGGRKKLYKFLGKPDPGVADAAKLIPVANIVAGLLIMVALLIIYADLFEPIRLF